jgi:dTDP-4-dehydrorhamnose 3,5-epimerase-like enzyme
VPRDSVVVSTMDQDRPGRRSLFGGKAALVTLARHSDLRGALTPFEFAALPFMPRRIFVVSDVPVGTTRGKHAHRNGRQLLVCLSGRVRIDMRSGNISESIVLDGSEHGLLIDSGVWAAQTYLVRGTVLLVLASEPYAKDASNSGGDA